MIFRSRHPTHLDDTPGLLVCRNGANFTLTEPLSSDDTVAEE